jgi:hypothetical protein
MGDIHATFVPAAQPDIIRAAEKDEFYRKARPRCAAQALRCGALRRAFPASDG